jgi:hypothetical protein
MPNAHLGALDFDDDPGAAQARYATGVRIADSSLPEDFGGVRGWGWIDNRPFLRCLHGLTLTSWRLGHHDRAQALCHAMLWLNPADYRRARDILSEITAGEPWRPRH